MDEIKNVKGKLNVFVFFISFCFILNNFSFKFFCLVVKQIKGIGVKLVFYNIKHPFFYKNLKYKLIVSLCGLMG